MGDVRLSSEDAIPRLVVEGELDAAACEALLAQARRLPRTSGAALLDLGAIRRVDSVGVAAICEAHRLAALAGVRLRLAGVSTEMRRLLESFQVPRTLREGGPARFDPLYAPTETPLEALGTAALRVWADMRGLAVLAGETVYWTVAAPFAGHVPSLGPVARHIGKFGADGIPIVGLIGMLMGVALAINASYQLEPLGALIYVPNLVGVAIARELGPLITAIVVSGRSGAEIAAEIGTMTVQEEVDALRTMGLNPVRFLVVPKTLALLVALPLLSAFADLMGIAGGYIIGVGVFGIAGDTYIDQTLYAVTNRDFISGLGKSAVFAVLIALVGCFRGFGVERGAEGVGRATTSSVVTSILLIIIADTALTTAFYYA